jgi:hypothetical protein
VLLLYGVQAILLVFVYQFVVGHNRYAEETGGSGVFYGVDMAKVFDIAETADVGIVGKLIAGQVYLIKKLRFGPSVVPERIGQCAAVI